MKKSIIILLLSFLLFSCGKNETVNLQYDENGQVILKDILNEAELKVLESKLTKMNKIQDQGKSKIEKVEIEKELKPEEIEKIKSIN